MRIESKNKEVIQSYIMTAAKYSFSVHEKRILYRLIEKIQYALEGEKLDSQFHIDQTCFEEKIFSIPMRELLTGENDKNYLQIKKALVSLRNKTIEIENEKEWYPIGIIEKPKVKKYEAIAVFEVPKEICEALFNFAKGHRKYELKTAMAFESVYAMRFYELFSNQTRPISYSIDTLKEMFGLSDKYMGKPSVFVGKVVEKAKTELDKKSPHSFTYTRRKTGRNLTHIDFFPRKTNIVDEGLEKEILLKRASNRWVIDAETDKVLRDSYGFTSKEINSNIDLFGEAEKKLALVKLLEYKVQYCIKRKNPKGTIIAIIKKELEDID
jgi:plasmid replication initiation protein